MFRFAATLAVILVALALVGCGSGHDQGGPATLSIMGFGSGDEIARARVAIAKRAIAPARVDNPNGAFSMQQFLTAVAGGGVPDLIYVDRQKIGTLAARGALASLDSCISRDHIDLSQYRRPAVREVSYRGSVYGIPEFYDNRTIIINDRVATQAGVPIDAISTADWDRLRRAAKKMAKVAGRKVARIGFDPKACAAALGRTSVASAIRARAIGRSVVARSPRPAASAASRGAGWPGFGASRHVLAQGLLEGRQSPAFVFLRARVPPPAPSRCRTAGWNGTRAAARRWRRSPRRQPGWWS